jgi:DNA replication protein DnaC
LKQDLGTIILDDIGTEEDKDAAKVANAVILFLKVLELNRNTGFIITTNLNSEELRNRYGDRLFVRIIGQLTILCLNPPSYRKNRAEIVK